MLLLARAREESEGGFQRLQHVRAILPTCPKLQHPPIVEINWLHIMRKEIPSLREQLEHQ